MIRVLATGMVVFAAVGAVAQSGTVVTCGSAGAPKCDAGSLTGMTTGWATTTYPIGNEPQDVAIQLRDGRLILIRKIAACRDVVVAFSASADVAKAECFR